MKKIIILMAYVGLGFNSIGQKQKALVLRVIDGDTYVLKVGNRLIHLRLNNVDAPELSQAWGIKSMKKVSDMIQGKTIDFDSTGHDLYGRVLGNVFFNDTSIDETLVSEGWAWYYEKYSNKKELAVLQIEAQKNKKGLWVCGTKNVCPPSVYRGLNKRNRLIYCNGCK